MKLSIKRNSFGSKINAAIRYFLRLIIYCTVGLALLMIPIFAYLLIKTNDEIGTKFEDRSWAVPARVYARPLEIFIGSDLKKEDLLLELELLNYQEQSLSKPGTYRVNNNTVEIYLRGFQYSDGSEPAQKIAVSFKGNKVSQLSSPNEVNLSLIRIEPLHIASIYPAHQEDRILLQRENIPPILIDTLLAMEDRQFYEHHGINPKGILRAIIENLRSGRTAQGGSTLTQQLIKNYFLTSEQSYKRKFKEMLYALVIDWKYPKDEVLEAYINEIYLSQDGARAIHGFGLASQFFFGKPVNELSLNNVATLVGVIPSPSAYNPRIRPDTALKRRNLVLDVLVKQNIISKETAEETKLLPLEVLPTAPSGVTKYPAFMDLVQKQLQELYNKDDLATGGLKIFTTLNPVTQTYAEKAVIDTLTTIEKQRGLKNLQSAIVITKNNTGEVEAIVGDRQVRQAGFNRALNANRQVGSSIKPFIYLRALEEPERYSLATMLDDETPFEMESGGKTWRPNNYDRRLHGWIPLISSLANSYNIPTIRIGLDIGIQNIIDTFYRVGLPETTKKIPAVPSLLLGAIDSTPFEMAQMYSTIANGGYKIPLRAIRTVTTPNGETLVQNLLDAEQVIYPAPNFLITKAMEQVVDAGSGGGIRRAGIKTKIAGKTGTTNDYRDSWFTGFSGDRTIITWVGKDDNTPTKLTGATGAIPVWAAVAKQLILNDIDDNPPNDITSVTINLATGLPPPEYGCTQIKTMKIPFILGYQPTYPGDCFFYPQNSNHWYEESAEQYNFGDSFYEE